MMIHGMMGFPQRYNGYNGYNPQNYGSQIDIGCSICTNGGNGNNSATGTVSIIISNS